MGKQVIELLKCSTSPLALVDVTIVSRLLPQISSLRNREERREHRYLIKKNCSHHVPISEIIRETIPFLIDFLIRQFFSCSTGLDIAN